MMNTNDLVAKIRELRELQALIDEATQEADSIKDELKAEMGDREELRAGEYKMLYKTVTTTRIDTTALKKAMPDIANEFTKTSTTRRFQVA